MELSQSLLDQIRNLIDQARQQAAAAINAELSLLYWQVGRAVGQHLADHQGSSHGQRLVASLASQLTVRYGRGWSEKQLRHCLRAAETFADEAGFSALRRQLSWTHLKTLMYLDNPLERDFYLELCCQEQWSTRQLQERIASRLFERSAISKKSDACIIQALREAREEGRVDPALLLKDPYILDFLDLGDRYLERDLEDAILRELEHFLLELGVGFSFVARQRRIQIDDRDYFLDLLFYNRKLRRLIVIELKLGPFQAEHKGQMELYLRYLAKFEQEAGEQPPLGIILCTGKNDEHIELLELDQSGIHVAEYLTVLPPPEVLHAKLQQSVLVARQRLLDHGTDS